MSTFSFGANWKRFLESLTPERFANAEKSLTDFLQMDRLEGLTFVDIGCGSGIFSHAAHRLGAERVVSIDLDPLSVECARHMKRRRDDPANWEVLQGSILDRDFVAGLGRFDIVYSWGVLHHTGRMWDAIAIAADLVKPGGYFYIAIYHKVIGPAGSKMWLQVKRFYNRAPAPVKRLMEAGLMGAAILYYAATGRNPITTIRNYKSRRGMSWKTDIVDWLGGYPYEFATVEEIFRFMKERFPDFQLVNLKTVSGIATNWFLYKRPL
jgi:2-polyprenyl-6-hydroxyphenyl methylase/3-demethylubiquinone-9 3-methyltransferase